MDIVTTSLGRRQTRVLIPAGARGFFFVCLFRMSRSKYSCTNHQEPGRHRHCSNQSRGGTHTRVLFPAGARGFFFLFRMSRSFGFTHPSTIGHEEPFPWRQGLKQLGQEADHSSIFMLRLRMSGVVSPFPIHAFMTYKDNFTFT